MSDAAFRPRHFVITGITHGIGRALALSLSRSGHRVDGCGRSVEAINACKGELGEGGSATALDVTDATAVERWAGAVEETAGAPEFLINNAALIHRSATVWETPAESFDPMVDVNIKGVMNVLRAFVPAMVARGTGIVVNLSSGAGRAAIPAIGGYCATKWAIEGLTKTLAEELPEPMAAIPLSPGLVDTRMLRTNFGEAAASQQSPEAWVERAIPMILGLSRADNGKSLTVADGRS